MGSGVIVPERRRAANRRIQALVLAEQGERLARGYWLWRSHADASGDYAATWSVLSAEEHEAWARQADEHPELIWTGDDDD